MAIADTVCDYLLDHDVDYHVFPHAYAESAIGSAEATDLPPERVAKAVVIATTGGRRRTYCVAVLPANHVVDLNDIRDIAQQRVELAKEYELSVLFPDCAVGAVPILGEAYGLTTVVDESIQDCGQELFFEAGDHQELIRIRTDQLTELMPDAEFAAFSRPLDGPRSHL